MYHLASVNYAGYFHDITDRHRLRPANNDALGIDGGLYPGHRRL